jgi:hypothetical protein
MAPWNSRSAEKLLQKNCGAYGFELPFSSWHSRSLTGYADQDMTMPGTIELAEVESLPAAERQAAIDNRHHEGRSHERGLDMGIGVPFCMSVVSRHRDQAGKTGEDVPGHVRISVLIDGFASSSETVSVISTSWVLESVRTSNFVHFMVHILTCLSCHDQKTLPVIIGFLQEPFKVIYCMEKERGKGNFSR